MDDPVRFTVSMLLMYAAISCILMTVCLLSEHPTIFTVVTIVCLVFCSLGGKILAQLFAHPAYISSPAARIVTDQALRFDPIQPLSEYFEWYTVYSDDHQDTIEYLEGRIAELDDERLRAGMQASLEHYKLEYDSHMERIMLFPFYQSAFLLAVGIGGALIFRKQDLK